MNSELFGTPIICHHYDLEHALQLENVARMTREDIGALSDDEVELEEPEPTALRCPTARTSTCPPKPSAPHLSGKEKKKQKKRERERAQRRDRKISALNSSTAPLPSPRILNKAATTVPIQVEYTAEKFRASQQRWTGPTKPVEHSLRERALDAEYLKQHMPYFDWPGDQSHAILDGKGRVVGVLIAPPEGFDTVIESTTEAFRNARAHMSFPDSAFVHRRATGPGFPTSTKGFAFGTGRQNVGNYKARSKKNSAAMDELMEDDAIQRMATFPYPLFQSLCFNMYSDYHETKQTLLKRNRHLHRTFRGSPFAAVTANLGPFSVSPPHLDGANKADGMCLISALGRFNADKGAHLVLWDYNLMIHFPAGRSALIPSAVVTHSNTPITDDEERFSLIQYSAGALFRWVDNDFQSDIAWHESATVSNLEQREKKRKSHCASALKKFSLWKDVKVKNFNGRARVEVWDHGDIADFSDLTEDSEVEEPPRKKRRT
ncbi:hypothetical protein C8R45DRAFT_1095156 [Mycena sanguinolenta]|nr:hypothetical protein C8R45DRAFT_1095156 [Mycena sanguinolenta]